MKSMPGATQSQRFNKAHPALTRDALIITCEHGGNEVPAVYAPLFTGHEALLQTHRGWDAGALTLAQQLATAFDAPLFAATTTRLLIDLPLHRPPPAALRSHARFAAGYSPPHCSAVLPATPRRG